MPEAPEPAVDTAAAAWVAAIDADASTPPPTSPWFGSPLSVTPHVMKRSLGLVPDNGDLHEVTIASGPNDATVPSIVDLAARRVAVNVGGHTHSFSLPTRTERWAPSAKSRKSTGDAIVAPFPAVVNSVEVAPGDEVDGDDVLVVIEAMKMLHSLRASGTSTVDGVHVSPGDQVATGDTLISFVEPEPT